MLISSLFVAFLGVTVVPNELTLENYVKQCEKEGVSIPENLSCSEGKPLPVYKTVCPKGQKSRRVEITEQNFKNFQDKYGDIKCDNPSHISTAPESACIPGSRIQRVDNCVLLCRRNKIAPKGKENSFNDINLICHNTTTGGTCFFNTKPNSNGQFLDFISGENLKKPGSAGETRWASLETVDKIGCIHCHDKGPFNITPFLKESGVVPNTQNGPYYAVGGKRFFSDRWEAPIHLVSPEVSACIQCHRIGSGFSCGRFSTNATGHKRVSGHSTQSCPQQNHAWMPPKDSGVTPEQTQAALEFMKRCCTEPTGKPIPGTKTKAGCLWAEIPHKKHLAGNPRKPGKQSH